MNIIYTSGDVGFITDPTKENSTESIVIDGFSFPKYLPAILKIPNKDVHFLSTIKLSENLKTDPVKRSLIPTIDTPSHSLVVSSSHIHPADTAVDNPSLNPQLARKKINGLKDRLIRLSNRSFTSPDAVLKTMDEKDRIYQEIIQYDIFIQTHINRAKNTKDNIEIYQKEIGGLIDELSNFRRTVQNKANVEKIDRDLTSLQNAFQLYSATPNPENEFRLKQIYFNILYGYYQ